MSDAQVTREQDLLEEFKGGLDPNDAPQLATRIAALEQERDEAKAARDAAEAKLKTKPKSVVAKAATPKPRKLGPLADDQTLDRDALKAAIAEADDVEIAFVDDHGREVAGSRPIGVSGEVWKDHGLGLMQSEPVEFAGPGLGEPSFAIAGYALILDGKRVAYTARSEPLNVAAGQKIKLVDDIYF